MGYSEHERAFKIQQYFELKSIVKHQEAFRNKFRNSLVPNRAYLHMCLNANVHSHRVYVCMHV